MDPITLLGAISSAIALIDAGSKLTALLFRTASALGGAGEEVRDLGIDISLLCAVLRQLQSALDADRAYNESAAITDAGGRRRPRRRTSQSALETTQAVLERCAEVFRKIEKVITGLHAHVQADPGGGGGGTGGKVPASDLDLRARIKWALKRGRVATYRATLDSCKITLTLMVTTLAYAERVAERAEKRGLQVGDTIEMAESSREKEDGEQEKLSEMLLAAHFEANRRLQVLELEDEASDAESDYEAQVVTERRDGSVTAEETMAGIVARRDSSLYETPRHIESQSSGSGHATEDVSTRQGQRERTSLLLDRLLDLEDSPPSKYGSQEQYVGARQESLASSASNSQHKQTYLLLAKFTDQGDRWDELRQTHGQVRRTSRDTECISPGPRVDEPWKRVLGDEENDIAMVTELADRRVPEAIDRWE